MRNEFDFLTNSIINSDDPETVSKISKITESLEIVEQDRRELFYMMMIEQFMDEMSCYAFNGWERGNFYGPPTIGKFHVLVDMIFGSKLDMRGATRLFGPNNENAIKRAKTNSGKIVLRMRFLRSLLDDVEDRNRIKARQDVESLGMQKSEQSPDMAAQQPF